MQKRGGDIRLPEATHGYLIDYLFEAGPTGQSGFGAVALTHEELIAWEETKFRGVRMLQPWELEFLHKLSAMYASTAHEAEAPDYPPPGGIPLGDPMTTAKRLRDSVRRMAK